jgi:MFS transporter, UMF1 family
MDSSSLIIIGATTPACGILGSLAFPTLQRRFGWTNLGVLVRLVLAVSLVPAYGCLGFLPFVRQMHVGGLTTSGEMFGLAVVFGACV